MQLANESAAPRANRAQLFLVQENLILLGGAGLFSLALASPLPATAAVACELLWLVFGSSSARVRRWLERRRSAALGGVAEPDPAVPADALDSEHARRVHTLERAIATIRTLGDPRSQPNFERAIAGLEALRPIYRSLCETHQRIGGFLTATTEEALVADADRLKQQFAAEKELGVRLTIRQALGAAQRRLDRRTSMAQLRRGIQVKLESVERSISYFLAQGRALGSNAGFSDDVEALLAEVGPAIAVDGESIRPASVVPSRLGAG